MTTVLRLVVVAGMIAGAAVLTRRPKPPPISPWALRRLAGCCPRCGAAVPIPADNQLYRCVNGHPFDAIEATLPWCPRSLELQRLYGYGAHKLDATEDGHCLNCPFPWEKLDPSLFVRYDGGTTP